MHDGPAYELINPRGRCPVVLTCEHASYAVPPEYQELGLSSAEIQRHIGWDIGARAVTLALAQALDAPAVCSGYSRLLIDCNRDLADHDLIVAESDGTRVAGNLQMSDSERKKRVERFYQPFHTAIDHLLRRGMASPPLLLSIHSFTPVMNGKERQFDLGVLFDRHDALAQEVGQRCDHDGYRVRYNEPYSGLEGLIFSARHHGERHGLVYLELEINNSLIMQPQHAVVLGQRLGAVLRGLVAALQP
jgi:predicted N-formylglutamate amidohydrolase